MYNLRDARDRVTFHPNIDNETIRKAPHFAGGDESQRRKNAAAD